MNRKFPIITMSFRLYSRKLANMDFHGEKGNYAVSTDMHKFILEKFLNRSERGGTVLSDIPTWTEYYEHNSEKLNKLNIKALQQKYSICTYETISDINDKVSIWAGDITKLQTDSIVNAANKSLLGGGGVDGAIHRAAGKFLLQECKTLGGCETGEAKLTGGYQLPAKYIIHTVGPYGEIPDLLRKCYQNCLKLAVDHQLRSIAFPCISTGVYGYPQEKAAVLAIKEVREFLEQRSSTVDRVIFCLFLAEDIDIYEKLMQIYFPVK